MAEQEENPIPSDRALIEKIRSLSPQRAAEVEEFVDFLMQRGDAEDGSLRQATMKLSGPAFREVWDNDDAAYDLL